jgi:hypothetical protein
VFYFSAHIVHVSIDAKQEKLYRRYDRKHEYRIQVCEDSYKYSDKMCVIRYTQCICKTPAPNWQPILKSMSDFHVTDICTSDLSHFFKFSNWHPILKSLGRKHIYLPHAQTAIYDSEVKLFLKQGISHQLGRGWMQLFDLNARIQQLTWSLIFLWKIFQKPIGLAVLKFPLARQKNHHRTTANFEHCCSRFNCIQPRPSWWDIPCFKNNFTSES